MSSLTLDGATGAMLGRADYAGPTDSYDISFPGRNFVVCDTVPIDEQQLRDWFNRFLKCWPTKEQIDGGDPKPTRDVRRKKPPDVGFILTGNVDHGEGFVISWAGGWIRGCASGCLLPVDFDTTLDEATTLRYEIEAFLRDAKGSCNNVG